MNQALKERMILIQGYIEGGMEISEGVTSYAMCAYLQRLHVLIEETKTMGESVAQEPSVYDLGLLRESNTTSLSE